MTRTPHCTYHCRACGAHFTSLRAFDSHRSGTPQDRSCTFPDVDTKGKPIVFNEIVGECRIAGPSPRIAVTLYEHESAARARAHFEPSVARDGSPETL